ncbi:MAG: cyclic nucleotide-binding domain-containing protein [Elusimicrobia bacterium]|nr:cyclic nucleotide-binding domain-containing protein [Elusimicrobiota bacterium]
MRGLALCEGLSERELGYLLQSFHIRVYNEGEALFLEGDIGRALFIVESGKIELSKHGADGKTQRLAELGTGALFGEMALLEQLPRSASATAVEPSTLMLLYRSKLDEILHYHPRIGVSVMRHLARLLSARLRRASDQITTAGAAFGK